VRRPLSFFWLFLFREVFLDIGQHFCGVFARVGLRINLADDALLVEHEGSSLRVAGRHKYAEHLRDLLIRVGVEGEIEILFVRELLLLYQPIRADADYHGIELSKLLNEVAEAARLDRSALG
jgi:hypothetical protein